MLGYTIINAANKNYTITIPSGGLQSYNVNFSVTNYNSVGGTVVLAGYWYHHLVDSVMQLTEKICDHIDDKYRFGYNTQEKVNEWAGIGNHNTALFWEYDTRIGRRLNLDPVVNPSVSPYATLGNSPIWKNDVLGNTDDWVKGADGNVKYDKDATSPETTKPGETYLGKAVVDFKGSESETLGEGQNLFGKGAKLADVTVYGPKGEGDIQSYKGYSMSSDSKKFGVIAEGNYNVSFYAKGKSGNLKSNWAINNRDRVPAKGGANPAHPERTPGYLDGTFIHSSNKNGFAGTYGKGGEKGISEGCLIILPTQMDIYGNVIKPGWTEFNNQLKGVHEFKLQLSR